MIVDLPTDAQNMLCNSSLLCSFLWVTWTIDIFHCFKFHEFQGIPLKSHTFGNNSLSVVVDSMNFCHNSVVVLNQLVSFPFLTKVFAFYLILKYVLRFNMATLKYYK